jgi:ubiquinone/menaquinone biosynthesis C-methylase UbiE
MVAWQESYTNFFYRRKKEWRDGTTEFHELIQGSVARNGRVLELGAGPTNPTTEFLASFAEVHGVDPDPAIQTNAHLTKAIVLDGQTLPLADSSFPACVSDYVAEHIADPLTHLREIHRVLSPGGSYVFRTVNKMHYIGLISAHTPGWFHQLVANRLRGLPSHAHAPYPTHYAMNTRRSIERSAETTGFVVETLRFVEKEPYYGRFSRIAYVLMTLYERFVNARAILGPLRANIFVVLRKPLR